MEKKPDFVWHCMSCGNDDPGYLEDFDKIPRTGGLCSKCGSYKTVMTSNVAGKHQER